jgi:hypothetical protein
LGNQSGLSIRVPKSVDIPADFWVHTESLLDELVTDHHVVNYIVKVGASFIVVDPATIHKLKLLILHQFLHSLLCFVGLPLPPRLQISRSCLGVLSARLLGKLVDDRVERELDTGHLLFPI